MVFLCCEVEKREKYFPSDMDRNLKSRFAFFAQLDIDKQPALCYNKFAKPIESREIGIVFFFRKVYLFSAWIKMDFDKTQTPLCPHSLYLFRKDWFGDYRSLRFCALTAVGALFYFSGGKENE